MTASPLRFLFLSGLGLLPTARSASLIVQALDSGWYDQTGFHDSSSAAVKQARARERDYLRRARPWLLEDAKRTEE